MYEQFLNGDKENVIKRIEFQLTILSFVKDFEILDYSVKVKVENRNIGYISGLLEEIVYPYALELKGV